MINTWLKNRKMRKSQEAMKQKLLEKMRPIEDIIAEMHLCNSRYLKAEKVGHTEDMNYYKGRTLALKWVIRLGGNNG